MATGKFLFAKKLQGNSVWRVSFVAAFLVLALLMLSTGTVHAGLILQPVSASTDMGEVLAVSQARDQSGLSSAYTSGVTDFDAYIATGPTHDGSSAVELITLFQGDAQSGNVDFDLGGLVSIVSMAFWNYGNGTSPNVREFTLLADDNASFTSPIALGSFTADPNTGPFAAVLSEVFSFSQTSASHVRMQITSNFGHSNTVIGEVAFEGVPEPSTFALTLLGILMLSCNGRRRRRR